MGGVRAPGVVLRRWANTPQTRNPFADLSLPVGIKESRVSSTPGCSELQPSPEHRGLPVSEIGGTAAENYGAERMSSWFWQQGIICLFWIRRRNSSPAQAGLALPREPWLPQLQHGQMAVTGAGHEERGPETPAVTHMLDGPI